ncbi:PREDICTED: uncharacterized protein LOC106741269 isoform X2 [Dinoponera quadriceps]|uniref:Uncharacterized protein LOC106741269 isoform X2 n=1 Tax=Dinoponera quadriceps TaxID=609295 RepID=A0A6P3WR73_DINQU|nr:PREDICTED: uncharacterized protein LOC106741269 isoform X2 [Dinoponera quadriceps]
MQFVNRKDQEMYPVCILSIMFDIIYRNCMKYTRYSYFAYKVLHVWLKRTYDTRFWYQSDIVLEQKLEAILFSNWSNAYNDVPKQNAQLFSIYLRIMSEKYNGFLEHIFDICDKSRIKSSKSSKLWHDETRFTILAEVLRLWDNVETMIENLTEDFVFNLCSTLAYKSLRCAATKVYMVILRKLSESEWKKVFGKTVKIVIEQWESKAERQNFDALHSLFKYWLDSIIEMHQGVFTFLWESLVDSESYCYCQTHLLMTAARLHIPFPWTCNIDRYINDSREITRVNIFATLCYYAVDHPIDDGQIGPFFRIEQFLWFNVNASSVFIRENIVKYFKILYSNILRTISVQTDRMGSISGFTKWLHEFLLDCFEIGSCYQRKILALKLYAVLLGFTSRDSYKNCASSEYLRNVTAINKYLNATGSWKFTNKESLFALLRLVLDSTFDVRQLAADLILKYFEKDLLSAADMNVIYKCGLLHCNSFKFYEVESGATFMKILAHWAPSREICTDLSVHPLIYSELLLNTARQQLILMKGDILKAVVQNYPFYGTLTALLMVAFRAGPESQSLTPQFMEEVLNLSKDATDFFLSTLFMKQSNTAYSSSFAEMGLAIDEHIKTSEIDDSNYDALQLSPAHQVLTSCIWMSLKVLCEVASEIGILMQSDAMVKGSMDIIVTVLLKCRHKGVVESAGVAIANLSKYLYGRKEYCELPRTYLTNLLEETTGELLHLTRRGSGLSIMFHKLVVSDDRKDRPTVHFAVQKLLRSLENLSVVKIRKLQSEEDSPWARRLHFLRALVADKEIHASLIPYMEEICLRCFGYIESDVWAVRNASLQLYGAVVPRLVGQCSGNKKDGSLDFADGCSLNHFVTHYPTLAGRMLIQLQAASKVTGTSGAALRSYARVAHTLTLLSRMWMGGCDLVDYPSSAFIEKLKKSLYELCQKPMIYIRQMAAKALVALTPSTHLVSILDTIQRFIGESQNDNQLYGLLLLSEHSTERLMHDARTFLNEHIPQMSGDLPVYPYCISNIYKHFYQRYQNVWTAWRVMCNGERYKQPCYMVETLFFEKARYHCDRSFWLRLFGEFDVDWSIIEHVIPSQKIQPGFFQFLSLHAQCRAWSMNSFLPKVMYDILDLNCTELSIGFLKGSHSFNLSHSHHLFEFILAYLISLKDDHDPLTFIYITVTLARRMMKNFSLIEYIEIESLSSTKVNDLIRKFCQIESTSPNMIYMKDALTVMLSKDETLVNEALSHVLKLSTNDEPSTRLIATDHIEFALRRLMQPTDESELTLIKCCLDLLKDEIVEIRDIVSTLLQRYDGMDDGSQHMEVVYQRFLEDIVGHLLVSESLTGDTPNDKIANVVRYFMREIKDSVDSQGTIENPFYHGETTFYKEESKFLNLCYLYVKRKTMSDESPCANERAWYNRCDATRVIEISRALQKKIASNCDNLQAVLCMKEVDYLTCKRVFVLQDLQDLLTTLDSDSVTFNDSIVITEPLRRYNLWGKSRAS